MKTEYDETVLDFWKLSNGNYIVNLKKDEGLDDDCDIKKTLPVRLRAFLSISKKKMYKFFREIDGFYTKNIFSSDTDSLYIERNF